MCFDLLDSACFFLCKLAWRNLYSFRVVIRRVHVSICRGRRKQMDGMGLFLLSILGT